MSQAQIVSREKDPGLDVGHFMLAGYPTHWIRILGRRLARVHEADPKMAIASPCCS